MAKSTGITLWVVMGASGQTRRRCELMADHPIAASLEAGEDTFAPLKAYQISHVVGTQVPPINHGSNHQKELWDPAKDEAEMPNLFNIREPGGFGQ
jgi:hypothetical protein